jgi:hypothetical protein
MSHYCFGDAFNFLRREESLAQNNEVFVVLMSYGVIVKMVTSIIFIYIHMEKNAFFPSLAHAVSQPSEFYVHLLS